MRRLLLAVARLAAAAAVVGTVRALRSGLSPRRALDGTAPVVGSIDTWPPVPRRPPA